MATDKETVNAINTGSIPSEDLVSRAGWTHLCKVRGRNFSAIDEEVLTTHFPTQLTERPCRVCRSAEAPCSRAPTGGGVGQVPATGDPTGSAELSADT